MVCHNSFHQPVLTQEVIKFLITDPAGIYVDATLGGGGHSEALLRHLDKNGKIVGIDRDHEAIEFCHHRLRKYSDQVYLVHGAFGDVDRILEHLNIGTVNGLFFDLGVSSHQIDHEERGFSYSRDGPLDMRMDSGIRKSGFEVVNNYSEKALSNLFFEYGEEKFSRRLARKIVIQREKSPIRTTGELAALLRANTPFRGQIKTLSRIFQAIRIEVNEEMSQLKEGFERCYSFLVNQGRIVVITYHSLEARMVKRFFRGEKLSHVRGNMNRSERPYHFQLLTKKSIAPSNGEKIRNPRARSARLRAAEKVAGV